MLAGNWGPELVDYAGGIDSLNSPGEHSTYIKWKVVRDYDPQVLIIAPCGFELRRTRQELHLLTDLPGWNNMSAVQNNRVFLIDGNAYFNRSGPRLVESLELLVNCVHPDHSSLPESMRQGKDWDTLTERA